MQLNEKTISILKNFADIQPNLVFREGEEIKTIAEAKNVMAVAKLDQEIPRQFGVYNLNEFLSVVDLCDDPELSFTDSHVKVSDGSGVSSVKYFYADESILTSQTKNIPMPEAEVSFKLSETTLNKIRKASSTLNHEKLLITPEDGSVRMTVVDEKDETSNSFSILVPGEYDKDVDFQFVLHIPNLKLISGDYEVDVSTKLISRFTTEDVVYYIALEKSSTYGG